jgi:protocatechuate 3,4-dioxygenase beta subunit
VNEDVKDSRLRISRRRALSLGGTIGLSGLLAACGDADETSTAASTSATSTTSVASAATAAAPTADLIAMLDKANTCVTSKEETQGPYWFDVDSIRTDIREERPGAVLQLGLRVQDLTKCSTGDEVTLVSNCVVEIWHCDAGGIYSGFEDASSGGGGGGAPPSGAPGGAPPSGAAGGGAPPSGAAGGAGGGSGASGETSDGSYSVGDSEAATGDDGTYLRGAQVADSNGIVQFTTIYPGWYRGRTMHIHLKVHIDKKTVLTSQLYVDDDFTDTVYKLSPYSAHPGRDTTNATDRIYDKSGLMTMKTLADGYLGVINIGIDV